MRRKKRNKQRKMIMLTSLSLLFILTVGYAAFQTNLNISAKGNIQKLTAAEYLKKECNQETGDGLYKDTYEDGRCIYKGSNPNNYITFNNELWRILAVETDGTLKIVKNKSIGNRHWDNLGTTGSNNWLRPASINTYLNSEYYNTLNSNTKSLIQSYKWKVGPADYANTDLKEQINSENSISWTGNIGLISLSDFIQANSNTEQCGNHNLNENNKDVCKTTNYLVPTSGSLWTITPYVNNDRGVFDIITTGNAGTDHAILNTPDIYPALYLNKDIMITGKGTKDNPYTITDK